MIGLARSVLLVEAALVVIATSIMVIHALVVRHRAHRREPIVAAARRQLVAAIDGNPRGSDRDPAAPGATGIPLAPLRRREQVRVLTEVGTALRGSTGGLLEEVATDLGLVDWARRRCTSRSWRRRRFGVRLLAVIGGGADLVVARADDPHPRVRAEALRSLADRSDLATVDVLLAALADHDAGCRLGAKDALVRRGAEAVPALRRQLEGGAPAMADALHVAARIADPRFLDVALQLVEDPRTEVRTGAVRVLGAVGGPVAERALVSALTSAEPEIRAAAATSLGRLGQWPQAGALAPMLDDPEWEVRRAAVIALASLGAPGLLVLRRAARGEGDGAGLARRVLGDRDVATDAGGWRP